MDGEERIRALFLKRPGEVVPGASKRSTDYKVKDGQVIVRKDLRWWIKKCTPPILLDTWQSIKKAGRT